MDRAKAAEEALKLAQNDKISGSVKSEASKPSNSTNTTNNANKTNSNNKRLRLIKIKITPTNNTGNNTTNTGNNTNVSTTDVALLAAILQCEAGSYDGMLAVATVIMNRVASPAYPNTLRAVIYQSGQFAPPGTVH